MRERILLVAIGALIVGIVPILGNSPFPKKTDITSVYSQPAGEVYQSENESFIKATHKTHSETLMVHPIKTFSTAGPLLRMETSIIASPDFHEFGATGYSFNRDSFFEGTAVELRSPPYNYPNPFRMSTGTQIGYYLTAPTDITVQVFDMRGSKIFEKQFEKDTPGGTSGYNTVDFNLASVNFSAVPSGIYFFVILNAGTVLGKGKMAILP